MQVRCASDSGGTERTVRSVVHEACTGKVNMTLAEFTRQLNLLTHIVEANGKSTDDIQVVVRINDDTSFYVVSLGTDEDGDVAIDY